MVLHVNVSPLRELKAIKMNLTLLRRATQHARKRRSLAPNTFHARIVLLPPFQSSDALSVLRLHLLETDEVGLQPPRLVITAVWGESLALRIHRSREPSESPVQTLSSRLRHAHLLLLCISRPSLVSPRPSSSPSGTDTTAALDCSIRLVLVSRLVLSCDVLVRSLELRSSRDYYVGLQVARKAIRDSAVVIVEGHCLRDEKVLKRRKRVPMNSTLGEICRTEVWSPLNVLARRVCMPRSKCALGRKLRKSLSIIPSR